MSTKKNLLLGVFILFITVTVINSLLFLVRYIILEKEAEKYLPKEGSIYIVPIEKQVVTLDSEVVISLDNFDRIVLTPKPQVVTSAVKVAAVKPVNYDKNKEKKIAIVIDDLGVKTIRYYLLEMMENKLNVAIIPGEEHSLDLLKYYKLKNNVEVIIHMPMESFSTQEDKESSNSKQTGYRYMITSKDTKKTTNTKLNEACASLLGAEGIGGINNHIGSYVTSSRDMVNNIVGWAKKNNLYVLDSLTVPSSVFYEQARKARVKSAYNQVFIDSVDDPEYIKKQLNQVKKKADNEGQVIAIGHIAKQYTLEVLFEWMPKMVEEGYTFSFVSELVQ